MSRHHDSIVKFLKANDAQLRKLARRQMLEDIKQSVWLVVLDMEGERGVPVNCGDEPDRIEILRRLARASDASRRGNIASVYLDQLPPGRDGEQGPSLLDFIAASDDSDPLEFLLHEEECVQRSASLAKICSDTYSQFSAYAILLRGFELSREDAATYLAVKVCTLELRIHRAFRALQMQPSLFDRIASIAADFLPPRGVRMSNIRRTEVDSLQYHLALTG
ncbi:MAG: hypothetical protein JWO70_1129 [Betaproteobacteria bacterium]|jgi:hypothetical protein|nr:hypothetical protein [Betaproteobacteria bacterium]